ncbi:MAG: hypothetical protein AAGM33_13165 [Pseudomonadota bacterium]
MKALSGMANWPTKLVAGEENKESNIASGISLVHENHAPAGEFRIANGNTEEQFAEIRYNPKHAEDPESLIATFAHELSHYLMSSANSDPPGGWEIHELTTDLTSVYLGFGIFMADSAWNFEIDRRPLVRRPEYQIALGVRRPVMQDQGIGAQDECFVEEYPRVEAGRIIAAGIFLQLAFKLCFRAFPVNFTSRFQDEIVGGHVCHF